MNTPEEFVAMVAHQLRSPLGAIRSASDMLIDGDYGKLPPKARETVILIKQSAERLLSFAETSLNASRLDSGAFKPAPVSLNPSEDIVGLVKETEMLAKSKGIRLTSNLHDLPDQIVVDRDILRNIIFNLLDNAVKFTDKGSVEIEAFAKKNTFIIVVSDTGPGLSEAEVKRMFSRYYRGQDHKQHPGIGLGLYVARQLAEVAGGTINVASEGSGKGTTFTVELPCERC